MKLTVKTAIIATALLAATSAQAANAITTANLNVRSGPGTSFDVLGTIPNGAPIDVIQCASNYNWCDVAWAGRRGWASSNYIAFRQGYARGGNFNDSAVAIGIPLLAGALIGTAISNYDYHRDWGRRPPRRPPPPPPPGPGFKPGPMPGPNPGFRPPRPGGPGPVFGPGPGRPPAPPRP